MSEINWTKPVETDEENPRPVRVLFNKEGDLEGCRVDGGEFDFYTITRNHQHGVWYADHGTETIPLRNVRPKKVKREGWVNVFESKYWGDVGRLAKGIYSSEDKAKADVVAGEFRFLTTIRIEWEEEE